MDGSQFGCLSGCDLPDDTLAYGNLYQWGRFSDGHQCRDSETTSSLSSTPLPGHADFITEGSNPWNWLNFQDDSLWQIVNGINNPCPDEFRIPTIWELNTERNSWSSNDIQGAFDSPLKFTAAGARQNDDGSIEYNGLGGYYWSSSAHGSGGAQSLRIYNDDTDGFLDKRASGYSIRCIKD